MGNFHLQVDAQSEEDIEESVSGVANNIFVFLKLSSLAENCGEDEESCQSMRDDKNNRWMMTSVYTVLLIFRLLLQMHNPRVSTQ